ncbi:MAG: patatin-like phospholipase family protein [Anaerolineae bacterium]
MRAFVLSGGGNRGALQVGALQVLLENGIRPEMLVGASAGAINAAFLAADPTPSGAHKLGEMWQQVTKEDVYPGGPLRVTWHLLTRRDSLYPSENFRAFLEANAPSGVHFFRQLAVHLYIVATDLATGRLYLFGEDPEESLLEAIMASIAIPPLFPPWPHRGRLLVDGGDETVLYLLITRNIAFSAVVTDSNVCLLPAGLRRAGQQGRGHRLHPGLRREEGVPALAPLFFHLERGRIGSGD